MVRFGMISWLPIYLLTVKHFSKEQMSVAFLFFEWAAIPSTLLAGWLSDKLFKGRRMPLAMICMALIFICLIGYWKSESLLMVTVFAAIVGCLIYVPQFLASVQTMEIVPSFAVGSAVGLRGFMSYIFGASLGTSLFGVMVDKMGWRWLTHSKRLNRENKSQLAGSFALERGIDVRSCSRRRYKASTPAITDVTTEWNERPTSPG